ncbi:hypothetical protein Dda_0486 [Drechslerella dactyloides]|uniref:AHC1-like C2H2 zinc-finger domain-containing protein n=1 Tax=Drechslerella dactyloides TaxID=74499 RepID=A0AAD6NM05_DREDA|nr:hypothetical protein Dda_0486 [Drechslerella dactyloides]
MTQQQLAGPLHPEPLPPQQPVPSSPTSTATAPAPAPSTCPKLSPSPPGLASHKPPAANAYTPSALKGIAASALQQPEKPLPQDLTPHPSAAKSFPSTTAPAAPLPPRMANPTPPHLKLATNIPMATAGTGASGTATPAAVESAVPTTTASPASAAQRQARPSIGGKRPPSMRQLSTGHPRMTGGQREQKIKDIITEQFNLEILIKHRELQDIESELGKAEACLEQIRRCAIHEAMEKDGLLDDPAGAPFIYTPSSHVLHGVYSGEYRDWLMEERVVEARRPYHDVLARDQSRNFTLGRRGVAAHDAPAPPPPASKRPQREAAVAAAQSQKRPSICLHRQHDGSIVKLACLDCKRSQFGSMQGFINHCRLAHQRDFQTHDHAAAACGTPFDPTGYEGQLPPPRSSRAASKYANTPTAPKAGRNGSNKKATPKPNNKKIGAVVAEDSSISNLQNGPLTPPFNPEELSIPKTIQTSHLKEYLSKRHMPVENLDTMVEEAVNRVGMVDESDGDEMEEAEEEVMKGAGGGISEKPVDTTPAPAPAAAPLQDNRPQTTDVEMMDTPVERMIEVKGDRIISVNPKNLTVDTTAVDSAYEGSEDITDVSETSNSVRMIAPQSNREADREEASRPSSRRSNTATRQSPRTPVAPTPVRMGTRAHPSPDGDGSGTRHSARLADFGKRT